MKKIAFLLALTFFFTNSILSQIPTDGLVGYWSFTGNANDESGNNYHGTLYGPVLTEDRFGNPNSAYQFDGLDDYIYITNSSLISGDQLTISCWIRSEDDDGGWLVMTGNQNDYNLGVNGDSITGWIVSGGSGHNLEHSYFNKNQWNNLILRYTGTELQLLLNNDLVKSIPATGIISTPQADHLTFGVYTLSGSPFSGFYKGVLDDVRIYSQALSDEELASLFNDGYCVETVYDTITIFDTVSVSGSYVNYTEQIIATPNDNQGDAVAIYENIAAIGRGWEDKQSISNSGAAQVYEYNGTSWIQTGDLFNPAGATDDLLGHSIATDGKSVIVGSPGEGNGAAFIYTKSGDNWSEQAHLNLDAGEIISNEIYAISSDIDGNMAVIGSGSAFGANCNSTGSAYVYEFDGNDWVKTARLTADDGQPFDNFGTDVKIHGNTIVVGAEGICASAATQGYAYVFEKIDGTWTQITKLIAPDGVLGDGFGRTLCLYDNKIVVGVGRHNSQTGAAYFYEKVGDNWDFKEKIVPNDIAAGDAFGYEVSIWENRLLAASNNNSNEYVNNGAAYIFEYNGTNWIERQKILPLEGGLDYRFGRYNDLSGSSAILKVQGGATHILKFHNVKTIYDSIPVYDTTYIAINDTITTEVFDTTFVTVIDSIAVTDTLIIDAVLTGIDPPDNMNTLKVYPNPARDQLFINTGDYTKMNGYQLKIIDQLGAIVFETNVEDQLYEVNLSTWSGIGLYYLQVIDSGGSIIDIRKIVLQ